MKKEKRTIVIIVLLVATAIYVLMLYQHIKAYENYVQEVMERTPPPIRPYVDPTLFIYWNGTPLYIACGLTLTALYVALGASLARTHFGRT